MAAPLTSVLLCAYRPDPPLLREAVESALAQTVPELEVVLVDDGSPEPVAPMLHGIEDPRLRTVRRERNRGLSAARNTALAAARAPLVSHLDADDAWEPDYLEHVLPRFSDPRVGLVYTNAAIVGHPGGLDTYIQDASVHPMDTFPKIAEQNPVPSLTATIRAEAVRRAGGYATWLRVAMDYYLWCKLVAAGWRFAYVDRKLARYSWPEAERGMSYDRRKTELDELKLWLAFFLRHPLTPGPRRQLRTRVPRELRGLASALAASRPGRAR